MVQQYEYKVLPWWQSYLLEGFHKRKPRYQETLALLRSLINDNMVIADIGCGLGGFSLAMAEMIGSNGKIIAIDLQPQVLRILEKRAEQDELNEQIQLICCTEDSLKLNTNKQQLDFVFIFATAHEITNRKHMFKEVTDSMKQGAKLLLIEPQGHVSESCFIESITFAIGSGLHIVERPEISQCYSCLLQK